MAPKPDIQMNEILQGLKSDKATQRHQAREALKAFFERASTIANFDEKGDGKYWLTLYQVLFECHNKELQACVSKTGVLQTQEYGRGGTALKKLRDMASLLRWITERNVERLNSRVLKSLLVHLSRGLVYRGTLLLPVALDFLKTTSLILHYRPHLYALKDPMWHDLVAVTFNIALGRLPRRKLAEDLEATAEEEQDSEMEIDDSWTFMCFAAIAHAESVASPDQSADKTIWDQIWTHSMRRANVPAVSRAACHTAHILLQHSKRLLSPQRVLVELESFAKDLDIQGPAFPYDSVCDLMVLCLRMANQDVRLYRMQMEEKVLSWLMESWRTSNDRRTSMPLHTAAHIHALLDSITGSSKRVRLQCGLILPHGAIVESIVEDSRTRVIQDFQLHARLPPHQPSVQAPSYRASTTHANADGTHTRPAHSFGDSKDLVPPRGRERRLESFLIKSLERALAAFDARDTRSFPTAEWIRSSMDLAVIAVCFEASLGMNGTQFNRRVLQAACKLLTKAFSFLLDHRWKAEERRLILQALDPLICANDDLGSQVGWDALVQPGQHTGIRTQTLRRLQAQSQSISPEIGLRRELQRFVFRTSDVQDAFTQLLKGLHQVLRIVAGEEEPSVDDFETTRAAPSVTSSSADAASIVHNRYILEICVTALSVIPVLQSPSGEPTRSKDLTDILLECKADAFLLLAPPICKQLGQKTLSVGKETLEKLFVKLDDICLPYTYQHSEDTLLIVVGLLDSTSNVWLHPSVTSTSLGDIAHHYCIQTVGRLRQQAQRSWRVQDAIIRFLDKYLVEDPKQVFWQLPLDGTQPDAADLPATVLPEFGSDPDIRLRFRIATVCPHLFTVGRLAGRDLMRDVYPDIHNNLSTNPHDYENILTRLLCLGNIVISEASVRRGAYWHLLEVAYVSQAYLPHLRAILAGVVERLGLKSLSDLCRCYAAQFAYSIRQAQMDLLKFPPELFGYRDRRECAEATFRSFSPTNLLASSDADTMEFGKQLFVRHCQAVQKTEQAGLEECFPNIVAYETPRFFTHNADENAESKLDAKLLKRTGLTQAPELYQERLRRHADDIVVSILKSLGDQDISATGDIAMSMRGEDEKQLFSEIDHCPLVNEQYRLLNAVSLWIAFHHDQFKNEILLRTLTRRATTMLEHFDLARGAQSCLTVRSSNIAFDFLQTTDDHHLALLGSDLMSLLEKHAQHSLGHPVYGSLLFKQATLSDLTSVLTDHGVSSSKFRLVRRICDLASGQDADEQFSTSDFWKLKACIPPENSLVDSDIDAFTSLLMLNSGRVDSIGRIVSNPEASPRFSWLFVTCSTLPQPLKSTWPIDIAHAPLKLLYLHSFSKPFAPGVPPNVQDNLLSDAMVHLAKDFDAWIAQLTTLLSNFLGARDTFFSPLAPMLAADHSFAEDLLPVLVHALLQLECDSSPYDKSDSMRVVLSTYFTSILSYEEAAVPCYRAIIAVVLHLRNFYPFTTLTTLSLPTNGFQSTSLFSLASDSSGSDVSDGSAKEQIMFDIYSHIDEPDGFYGIQTDNLRNFFVQRLHHENQWDKAFRFHGAMIESGSCASSATDGIVQSLSNFGFNHLALTTMQTFSADSQATSESNAVAYNLGWRAETWDLPDNLGDNQSGSTLYLALRAVYRERNPQAVDSILRRAFTQEMTRLRNLGIENFVEIREVIQVLLCLRQIRLWRGNALQQDLQAKQLGATEWKDLVTIGPDFEFGNMEAIMATRISLIRSARQKEQRNQIGDLVSPFCASLIDLEKSSLLCLSERSRSMGQAQFALNSILKAQTLEQGPTSQTSQEFSDVLWLMKEPKLAIKSLNTLLSAVDISLLSQSQDVVAKTQHALLLSRLGTWSGEASMKKPSGILEEYFNPATTLLSSSDKATSSSSPDDQATVFHQYAIFAERQYHILSKSPDALRLKFYVDRKTEETKQRNLLLSQTPSNSSEAHRRRQEHAKAEKILQQDKERYGEHIDQQRAFLTCAVDMYAKCLSASDRFDDDSHIRLCSLWLANFDTKNEDLERSICNSINPVPSRKYRSEGDNARFNAANTAFVDVSGKCWSSNPDKVVKAFNKLRDVFPPLCDDTSPKAQDAMSWFAMRLHYSRSVATTSIVGHILGLGDRHTSNILMDNKTGEVVHIDLGIAFEQGKLLPQPERVPFRLTADMIDGLGISGTQGVFQRCAEETLRVLRDGSETILTVLEVFKYDPLHSWYAGHSSVEGASEFKIKRAQQHVIDETAHAHEAADRALSSVSRKLDKTLSVEYTVNELITEASDPGNLGLMYTGWSPHY
ncbi:uncharacterized protein BXZ73DRAFT_98663 [Epithele typhae]|uniref:uncharacterized protein n=1 Tax=Epithele typhae TaxID=378194 RepID=UPI0020081FB9|nr:uncharacterized protein BXZ73DRAFT_98663 [Epithele typhae]KAH9940832.1 hypothetical protein BXZ73DRAFT_98663 [Epithele typhae]